MKSPRSCLSALVGLTLLGGTTLSRAQDASSSEQPRSEQLQRTFSILAADEQQHRTFRDGASLVFGTGTTAAGIVLIAQDTRSFGGYAITAAGCIRLVATSYDVLLGGGSYERLASSIAQMRTLELREPEILDRIDAEWRAEAHRARVSRVRFGIVEGVLGTLLFATGLVIALDQAIPMSNLDRGTRAAPLLGVGSLVTTLGVADLVIRNPVEVGYEIFRSNGARDGNDAPSMKRRFDVRFTGRGVGATWTF